MKIPKPKPIKASGDLSLSFDPASNIANATGKAIESLSKSIGGVYYEKEKTKQTKLQTEGNITLKGLDNKEEVIKGAFNVLSEVISCGKAYINYLEVKKNTEVSISQLDKEKEKTRQIEEESKRKITESNNRLEEIIIKVGKEKEEIEIRKGHVLINVEVIRDLLETTRTLRELVTNDLDNSENRTDYLNNLGNTSVLLVELAKANSGI